MMGLRLLLRDWRGGDISVLVMALVLAVGIVTGLGLFSERLGNSITAQSSNMLGADLVLEGPRPVNSVILEKAGAMGQAKSVAFPSMVSYGERFQFSFVKAVDSNYPLKGDVLLADSPYASPYVTPVGINSGEVWAERRLLESLELGLGDKVEIGQVALTVTRVLVSEPEGITSAVGYGPRLLMHYSDLDAAGVVQPGSRVIYRHYFVGDAPTLASFRLAINTDLLPENRVYGVKEGRPRVAGAIERAQSYLLLGGALGVMLAGAAIAIAARRYTQRHVQNVAVLKTLGADSSRINLIYIQKFFALSLVGIGLGFAAGFIMQAVIVALVRQVSDVVLESAGWYPWWLGAATGLVSVFAFALPPVIALRKVSPLAAIRSDISVAGTGPVVSWACGIVGIFGLMYWYTSSLLLTGAIFAGLGVAIAIVAAMAWGLIHSTRLVGMQAGNMWLLATSSLRRRGVENAMQIVVFAITLMLFLVLLVIRTSLIGEWQEQLPAGTPNHFLVNVLPAEVEPLDAWLDERGLYSEGLYPIVRARLTHINDQQVIERVSKDVDDTASIDRELNLTWSQTMPTDNRMLAGQWWPENTREALVSVESRLAERFNMAVGDNLRFQLAGELFEARLSSIREVDWEQMRPNFYMIFPPGVLDQFPATYITSFYLPDGEKAVLGELIRTFPSLSVIEMDVVIEQVRTIIDQVSLAVESVLWVVIACGGLVLVATVQSGMADRFRESSILRTLGAPARLVLGAITIEFVVLGLMAGLLASLGAEATAWMLQVFVFKMAYVPHPRIWLIGPLLGTLIIGLTGSLASRKAVSTPPIEVLRNLG